MAITGATRLEGRIVLENLTDSPIALNDFNPSLRGSYSLSAPGLAADSTAFPPLLPDIPPFSVQAFDGETDFAGPDSFELGPDVLNSNGSVSLGIAPGQGDLTPYVGAGTFNVTFDPTGVAETNDNNANFATLTEVNSGALVSVVYTYEEYSISGNVLHGCPNDPLAMLAADGGVVLALSGVDTAGNPIAPIQTTTAADGTFSFVGVPAGTYNVTQVTAVPGRFDGPEFVNGVRQANSIGSDSIGQIVVGGDVLSVSGITFTDYDAQTVTGSIFVDANDNGVRDPGEAPQANVNVVLSGLNYTGNAITPRSVTTDADGNFTIANVPPALFSDGNFQPYNLNVNTPDMTGFRFVSITDDRCAPVAFSEAGALNSISGRVLHGCPPGAQDPLIGEAGVVLTLTGTDAMGNPVGPIQTTTLADGSFSFQGLRPGTYSVAQSTMAAGRVDGPEYVVENGVMRIIASGTDTIDGIVLTTGDTTPGVYAFVDYDANPITGTIYRDSNANGSQESDEVGFFNQTVILTGTDFNGNAIAPISTTTNGAGQFLFPNVAPGNYAIQVVEPDPFGDRAVVATAGPCSTLTINLNQGQGLQCVSVTPRVLGIHNQPTVVLFGFNAPIDPTRAQDVSNYAITTAGRDGRFGTADDRSIPIASASYDPNLQIAMVVPSQRLALGQAYSLFVRGPGGLFEDTSRGLVGVDGTGCGDYQAILERGTHVHFTEADGDRVSYGITQGGVLELYRSPNGDAAQLYALNGTAFTPGLNARSYLQGGVIRRPTGNGTTVLPTLLTAEPSLQIRLNPSRFSVLNRLNVPSATAALPTREGLFVARSQRAPARIAVAAAAAAPDLSITAQIPSFNGWGLLAPKRP